MCLVKYSNWLLLQFELYQVLNKKHIPRLNKIQHLSEIYQVLKLFLGFPLFREFQAHQNVFFWCSSKYQPALQVDQLQNKSYTQIWATKTHATVREQYMYPKINIRLGNISSLSVFCTRQTSEAEYLP